MAILLTTVKRLLHSTLHSCPAVSGFVDLFELQSLFKAEDLSFIFHLSWLKSGTLGFPALLELKAHDSTNSWGARTPEKQ